MFLQYGADNRKNARCPHCGSLERDRLTFLIFKNVVNVFQENVKLLHINPKYIFSDLFEKHSNIDHWPVEINKKDKNSNYFDIEDMAYKNNSFDVVFLSHVLEYLPNDMRALEEIYRVIKPAKTGAYVVIVSPIFKNLDKTEEREFNGQMKPVRSYGIDFSNRLKSIGFHVQKYDKFDLIEEKYLNMYGIFYNS
ncbi:hypothetical protein SDC9_03738 [bioreactor metagenome]|uniref:Methyltransferase type 11 domain-containing protein n=1 Tax=bioreactor metagenome TaxID=1076179 RepID=A0A644SVB3_9ZZZZ|nr:class I SAM-dependent methyltransferase [Methanobrevibacter sp.]MEA4956346.1 class I SAM-dependent methyltransferase [Methanobrevibacter sp.]